MSPNFFDTQHLTITFDNSSHEIELLLTLCKQYIKVHRAHSRKIKNFIRSYGNDAKTDSLDARALALYGFERAERLELYQPQSERYVMLNELIQRRFDLKQIIVAEKNRLKSPGTDFVKSSCELVIKVISKELVTITAIINSLIEEDELLQSKKDVIKTIAGIGDITANDLLVILPKLGLLDRRKIASLAGVAPKSNDSGTLKGYRHTGYGRNCVKSILFLAAMAARRSNSELKIFYENLINRGKKKMVALTALMRKIIVIANAKLRDLANRKLIQNKI